MNYTLVDRGYFDALKIVSEELDRQGIAYALVGGAGVQARISDILCRANKNTIANIPDLETLLRKTKDFDITSKADESDFVRFFNEIQALNPHLSVIPERARSKKIILNGKSQTHVDLNYQTGPQDLAGLDDSFYFECIDTAEEIILPYNGVNARTIVAKPEYLITSKLTRADPKDIWDIGMLLKVIENHRDYASHFKPSKVRDLLERAGKGEIYGRLEEIKRQILKE